MKITLNELRQLVKSVIREEVSQGVLENTFEGWSKMLFSIAKEKVEELKIGEEPTFTNSEDAFYENKRLIISTIEESLADLGVFDDREKEYEPVSHLLSYYEHSRKFFAEVMKKIMDKYKDYKEDMSSEDYAIVDMYNLLKRIVISYYFE
jgi:hypothetical protein